MKHQYESELIEEIVDSRGHKESSLHYESECVKSWIEEAKGAYPKLCDYESEWLKYISVLDDTGGGEDPEPPIGEFPYVVLSDVTEATIDNVVPYAYKTAILKGKSETIDETLQSVKTPVLTTFNTYNIFNPNNTEDFGTYDCLTLDYYPVENGTKLSTTSLSGVAYWSCLYLYDENKTLVQRDFGNANKVEATFTISNAKAKFVRFKCPRARKDEIVLNYGDIKPYEPYAPYQSNILTVNENVVLRGIGDVKDELDCITGQVTERIGKIVLNDSLNWSINNQNYENTVDFYVVVEDKKSLKYETTIPKVSWRTDTAGIVIDTYHYKNLAIRVEKSSLSSVTVEGFKEYIKQNPITVLYELATESIKTVDLNIQDQNGKTLSVIKPIEGKMFVSTSSDTIKPLFSGEIPVEAITQNLASFIDFEMEE